MNRLFAFHLLNDNSGSPKILRQVLPIWDKNGYEVHLYTSYNQIGFLTDIPNVNYHRGWYIFSSNPILRLFFYTCSQLLLVFKMYRKINASDTIYINTVLPFGAAIIGKLKGCRIIYHIHETSIHPKILHWFLFKIVLKTAIEVINVSKYVADSHRISSVKNHLVFNSIDSSFLEIANSVDKQFNGKNVLMICSLKKYKGIFEFITLAEMNIDFNFKLVLNASMKEINQYFKETTIPSNLTLVDAQKNVHPFYRWADVILNLSIPELWVETFGLTIIEGMAYGLPAIVPQIGGITEVIEEDVSGYKLDSRTVEQVSQKLNSILKSKEHYNYLSTNSKNRISLFSEEKFNQKISEIIYSKNI